MASSIANQGKSKELAEAMTKIGGGSVSSSIDAARPKHGEATSAETRSAKEAYQETMAAISSGERGDWGEAAVASEARRLGHRLLLKHVEGKSTTPGYDCVSWDGRNLHIWEAKNYSETTGNVSGLSAMDSEKRLSNVKQFLKDLAIDDPERPKIAAAIQQNQVHWHIRLGPDTDISFEPLDKLGWESVDVKAYSYEEMMKLRSQR